MGLKIRTEREAFLPGEAVRGVLHVTLNKAMRARKIQIALVGREHAVVVRGGGKNRRVYKESRNIVSIHDNPWQATETDDHIGPVEFSVPFEFTLPEFALPSIYPPLEVPLSRRAREDGVKERLSGKQFGGKVEYVLKAKVDRPFWFDKRDDVKLAVLHVPRALPARSTFSARSETKATKPDVAISVEGIAATPGDILSAAPGGILAGEVTLVNEMGANVRVVAVRLQCIFTYTARGHTDEIKQVVDQSVFEPAEGQPEQAWAFELRVPEGVPYTTRGEIVSLTWRVDAKADLPLKRDPHARVALQVLPTGGGPPPETPVAPKAPTPGGTDLARPAVTIESRAPPVQEEQPAAGDWTHDAAVVRRLEKEFMVSLTPVAPPVLSKHRSLRDAPYGVAREGHLVELALANLTTLELPPEVRQLSHLECLYLHKLPFRTLPAWLAELPRLRALYLSNMAGFVIPPELADAPRLEYLYIIDMDLWELPEALRDAPALKAVFYNDEYGAEKDLIEAVFPEAKRRGLSEFRPPDVLF